MQWPERHIWKWTPPLAKTEEHGTRVAIIGGGPAGLMAAEVLCGKGVTVDLYDAMPSLGRKFLMAGKSGLNLTHAEPPEAFAARFHAPRQKLSPILDAFAPTVIRDWASGLGVETFVGTSGRVFPTEMKAAPLLRAWLRKLRASGLCIHVRHKWTGWTPDGGLTFVTPAGEVEAQADVTLLALGGASWPALGSDGSWLTALQSRGVAVSPLQPSNCGFDMKLSAHILENFHGHPLKGVTARIGHHAAVGDCMVTDYGLEGGPIYALSAVLRDAIARDGAATIWLDLAPDLNVAEVAERLSKPRGKKSMATHLRRSLGLTGVKAALLREGEDRSVFDNPQRLAAHVKSVALGVVAPRPIAEAISTAGGVAWDQVTDGLELTAMPGVFVAGEMLDWDAPTGGYLLSACFSTGRWAGNAIARKLGAS